MIDLHSVTIISGGQTGADRAALDFAIEHIIPHGGWCPRGRRAEDGPIDAQYGLEETPSRRYAQRTEWNVRDSDATVVFSISPQPTGGTALTLACARRLGKPTLHLWPGPNEAGEVLAAGVNAAAAQLRSFLSDHGVRRLNIAGPRASQEPAIAAFVHRVLQAACET